MNTLLDKEELVHVAVLVPGLHHLDGGDGGGVGTVLGEAAVGGELVVAIRRQLPGNFNDLRKK